MKRTLRLRFFSWNFRSLALPVDFSRDIFLWILPFVPLDNIVGLTGDDKFLEEFQLFYKSHETIDFWVRKSQAKINKDNARNVSNNFKRKSSIILLVKSICHKMDDNL